MALNMTKAEIQARSRELQAREGSLEFIQKQSRETLERLFGIPTDTTFTFNANDYGGFVNTFKAVFVEKTKSEIERERKEKEQKGDTTPIDPLKKTMRSVSHSRPDETAKLLEKVPEEYNVYVGRNTYTQRGRMGTDRLYNYRTAIVDIDAHEIPVEEANALARVCAYELKKEIDAGEFLDIEPTAVTETGRGVQIIWSFTPMSGKQDGSLAKYKTLARLLCLYMERWLKERPIFGEFNIDSPVSQSAPGLIRLPGSVNVKAFEALGKDFARVVPYNPQEKRAHNVDQLAQALANKLDITVEGVQTLVNEMELAEKQAKAQKKAQKRGSGKSPKGKESGRESLTEDALNGIPLDICEMDFSHMTPQEAIKFLETHMSFYEHSQRYNTVVSLLKEKYPEGVPIGLRDFTLYILGNLLLKFTSISAMFTLLNRVAAEELQIPFTSSEIESLMSTSIRIYSKNGGRGYPFTNQYICNTLGLNIKSFPHIVDFRKLGLIRSFTRIQKQTVKNNKQAEAKALRAEGLTIKEVAKRMDVSTRTIYRWTQDNPAPQNVAAEQPIDIPYIPYVEHDHTSDPEDDILSFADWLNAPHKYDPILPSLDCINEADDILNLHSSFFRQSPDPEKDWNDELNDFLEQRGLSYVSSSIDDVLSLSSRMYVESDQVISSDVRPNNIKAESDEIFDVCAVIAGPLPYIEEYWDEIVQEEANRSEKFVSAANVSKHFETTYEGDDSYFPTPEQEAEAEVLYADCPIYDVLSGTWVTLQPKVDDSYFPTPKQEAEAAALYADYPIYDAASGTWFTLSSEDEEQTPVDAATKSTVQENRCVAEKRLVKASCVNKRSPNDNSRMFPKETITTRTAKKNIVSFHPLFLFMAKHIRS